ncbi:hypothetical protein BGZ60DRAFT_532074 [Tricladium varicosporioides]|nr:hypothetical protein BGZ60DRAFT_532074 [Hymenoscyphus varicosporioides]
MSTALAPTAEIKLNTAARTFNLENNTLSQAVIEQTAIQRKKESYLRHLANIKIQFTKINNLNNSALTLSDYSKLIDSLLLLDNFASTKVTSKAGIL